MLNLEKIKKFLSDRESFAEVRLINEANKYTKYSVS